MTHLDTELQQLKAELISMWMLVISQLQKTHDALISFDKQLAHDVIANEKRVNALELKIDRDCENIFALFNPVAIDLRFVLAVLKINNNLERTGDIAEGIAQYLVHSHKPFDKLLVDETQILSMYEESTGMLEDVLNSFQTEDTALARKTFIRDEKLDSINLQANSVVANYIRKFPESAEEALYILSAIRKLERIGDQCKNIAEEIIFYSEAKVMKHSASKISGEEL
jgi:phosphate transport system protein